MKRAKIALLVGAMTLVMAPIAAEAGPPKSKAPKCKSGNQGKGKGKGRKCPTVRAGRMTGHGQVFDYAGYDKVQWEFRNSVCQDDRFPDLKVEFGDNVFVLEAYTGDGLVCIDTAADEGQPRAGFDTIRGQGTGELNGEDGASATFRFTDDGEPGTSDTADITILDAEGEPVLVVTNVAIEDGGNHQAHRVSGRG